MYQYREATEVYRANQETYGPLLQPPQAHHTLLHLIHLGPLFYSGWRLDGRFSCGSFSFPAKDQKTPGRQLLSQTPLEQATVIKLGKK